MGFGEIVWNVHKCKMVSAAQFSTLASCDKQGRMRDHVRWKDKWTSS